MTEKPTIKGIIFDFDGLILDSETPIFQAWRRLYREYGQELHSADWADIIGRSPEDHDPLQGLSSRLEGNLDLQEAREKVTRWEEELVHGEGTLPGVKEVIAAAKLADLKLGIASASNHDWVEGHLARLELLEHFDFIGCSDDVSQSKPSPEVYKYVLDGLGLDASQAVVLEDSPHGVLAAKRAGLYCVAVPNPMTKDLSFTKDGHQPDMVLDSLTAFPLESFLA